MSTYTSFISMTSAEAATYLNAFLDEMRASLDRFGAAVDRELTYSPSSLEEVWSAALPRLAWRPGYSPPPPGAPGPRLYVEQLEPPRDMPSWFHHPSAAGYARFSLDTLWLVDGLARYLGEICVRNVGCRWEPGDSRNDDYLYRNQPVLAEISTAPVSPMQTCAVLVSAALRPMPEEEPRGPAEIYGDWGAPQAT